MEKVTDFRNTWTKRTSGTEDWFATNKILTCATNGFFYFDEHEKPNLGYYDKHKKDKLEIKLINGEFYHVELTQQEISEVIDKQLAEETKSEIIVIGGGADVKRNIKRYLDKNKTYEITIKEVISIN